MKPRREPAWNVQARDAFNPIASLAAGSARELPTVLQPSCRRLGFMEPRRLLRTLGCDSRLAAS